MKTNPANPALKKLLIILSRVTDSQFAELVDGKTYNLDNGGEIPKSLIDPRQGKPDGLYALREAVCSGNGCSIGKPKQACIDNKCYKKTECALYYLDDLKSIHIEYDTLLELAKQYK